MSIIMIGYSISAPSYSGPVMHNFDGKNFINPAHIKPKGLWVLIKWMMNRQRGDWTASYHLPYGEKPVRKIDSGIRITFINHATFLIQLDGINILTDPIWSDRASPFIWIGPRRMRPPGIRFNDLPTIDYVLISHNHYDHLDITTLKSIVAQHKPKIITPLGVKAYLHQEKLHNVDDMNWWEEKQLNASLRVQSVPALHFSGRGIFDRNATLWCGYTIKAPSGNVYVAGDTGYHPETFKEIGKRAGPIKVALIPIGAYKPRWFMAPVHCSPEDAVKIHLDLHAQHSIGMHYGTFAMGDDGQHEPVNDLKMALKKFKLNEHDFLVLQEGTGKDFS